MAIGSIASAIIGNKGASKAAKAQVQSADKAVALQREIYGRNEQVLSPYAQAGIPATGMINALLGLPAPQQQALAQQASAQFAEQQPQGFGGIYQRLSERFGQPQATQQPAPTQAMGAPAFTQPTAEDAFARYRNSTGYQFRIGQGLDAINSGYAGAGALKSGAAMKAINDYGQGMASQEFGNYLNALGNQQGLGFSAGSAIAGVGQNFANSVGNLYQSQGEARANAALTKAQNTSNAVQAGMNALAKIIGGGF